MEKQVVFVQHDQYSTEYDTCFWSIRQVKKVYYMPFIVQQELCVLQMFAIDTNSSYSSYQLWLTQVACIIFLMWPYKNALP